MHGIWGFAKDFGLSGLKVGVLHTAASAAGEHALWQRILRSGRVNILPGTAFGCPEPGWFRLCHATNAGTVATGTARLTRVLETA